MNKHIIGYLATFAAGIAATNIYFKTLEQIATENVQPTFEYQDEINENPDRQYQFSYSPALSSTFTDNPPYGFTFTRRTYLTSIEPENIRDLCYTMQDQHDGTFSLNLNVYFTQDYRQEFADIMRTAEGHPVKFEWGVYMITDDTIQEGAVEDYLERAIRGTYGDVLLQYDYEFTAYGPQIFSLLEFANGLAPDIRPKGCSASFDSSKFPNWNALVNQLWGDEDSSE